MMKSYENELYKPTQSQKGPKNDCSLEQISFEH